MSEYKVWLDEVTRLPMPEDEVSDLAGDAWNAAGSAIVEGLKRYGMECSGDFSPGETFAMEALFSGLIRAYALNSLFGNAYGGETETFPDDSGFLLTGLEACAPEHLVYGSEVLVRFVGTMDTSSGADIVDLWAPDRATLVRYVSDHWGQSDSDWFAEYVVARIEPLGDEETAAAPSEVVVRFDVSGLTSEERDALVGEVTAQADPVGGSSVRSGSGAVVTLPSQERELQVCADCYFAHHYGATERDGLWFAGESDSPCDREPLVLVQGYDVADWTDSETGEGIDDFSWRSCEGCGSTLGGARFRLSASTRAGVV